MQPALADFMLALSKSQGADPTLAALYGGDIDRNGEPFAELGMVRQGDAAWGDQHGGPRDPQPGNGKAKRDVLVSAGAQPLFQTAAATVSTAGATGWLSDSQLTPIVAEARLLWSAALGENDGRLASLDGAQIMVGNLPGDRLGVTLGRDIFIDSDAAGYGWIFDGTGLQGSGGMDPLSVVMHEMGHLMGFDDDDHAAGDVMSSVLEAGTRQADGRQSLMAGASEPGSAGHRPVIDWDVTASLDGLAFRNDSTGRAVPWLADFRMVEAGGGAGDDTPWTLEAPRLNGSTPAAKARSVTPWLVEFETEADLVEAAVADPTITPEADA
jgi:hypothetical protein